MAHKFCYTANKTNLADVGNVSGATTDTLTITNVQAGDAGEFSVVVTDASGSVTSVVAVLRVTPSVLGEALDAPHLAWSSGGNALWTAQTAVTHDVVDAAQSGTITDNQETWVETSVVGPGPLSFWWKVSSESFSDRLEFYINGTRQAKRISGEVDWQVQTYTLEAGTQVLRWRYIKNSYFTGGQDRGWVDQVSFTPQSGPPVIVTQPKDQTVEVSGTGTFIVTAGGSPPLSYQWRHYGTNLAGQTSASLMLSGVTTNENGPYAVVVTNAYGSVTSVIVSLTVAAREVTAWGLNSSGQTNVPAGLSKVVAVAAGTGHSLALRADGTVRAWGDYYNGSTYVQMTVPSGLSNVVAVAAQSYHCLALKGDGTVTAWPSDAYGATTVPTDLSNVVAVAAGGGLGWGFYSLALRADGTVAPWGYSQLGATDVPKGLSNAVAVAAGESHSLALRADGTVAAWGDNSYGQTNVPVGLSNVVAVAAGDFLSLALRAAGTAAAWGGYRDGTTIVPMIVPQGLSNVVAVAAGSSHSLALQADGTLVTWGDNSFGQTNVPAGLSNLVAVAGGGEHSLALINAVTNPVQIVKQPLSQVVLPRANVTLFVLARGTPPLSYQWRFNGTNIAGATNVAYTLSNVQPSRLGEYSVLVANRYGSVTSSNATLTLPPGPPSITTQPQGRTVQPGSSLVLSVNAIGTLPLGYQWFKDDAPLADNGLLTGTQTSDLSISNAATSDSGQYWVVVTNSLGVTNSHTATVTVQDWVVIGSFDSGGRVTKRVAVSGNRAYLANGHDPSNTVFGSLDILDVSDPGQPVQVGGTKLAYADVNSVAVAGGLAYLASGFSPPFGLAIVDVNNPAAPSLLGVYDTTAAVQHGTDVVVSSPIAYLTAGETLQVLDVSVPASIVRLGLWTNAYTTGEVNMSGNHAYVTASGLHSIDVSNPTNPVRVGGTAHDYIEGVAVSGDFAYTVGIQDFRIYDVANPSNIWQRSRLDLSNSRDVSVSGGVAYVARGSNGLAVVDVSNPDAPVLLRSVTTRGEAQNVVVAGNLAYVADGLAGLTIVGLGPNTAPQVPFILSQPVSRIVSAGDAACFSVRVAGVLPLVYQWRKDGTNLFEGGSISGVTNATLCLSPVQSSDVGGYSVVVTNSYGSVTSSVAALTVCGANPAWDGADDFSSGIAGCNWTIKQANAGQMTVIGTNGHASFLVPSATTASQNAYIIWHGTPKAAEDWTVEVTGHNSAGYSAQGASALQLAVLRADGVGTSHQEGYVVAMGLRATGCSGYGATQWINGGYTNRATVCTPNIEFRLRLVYRSASGIIEAWYDPDASGLGWTLLDTISLADFSPSMTASNTFTFAILGNTYYGPITEGEIWADNFSLVRPAQAWLQFCCLSVSNGVFQMRLNGTPGAVVVVNTSFDLKTWTPWQTNTLPAGGLPLAAPMGTNRQFFRARIP